MSKSVNENDIDMSEICSCQCTLDWCEKHCERYYSCDNVAIANDILVEREENNSL